MKANRPSGDRTWMFLLLSVMIVTALLLGACGHQRQRQRQRRLLRNLWRKKPHRRLPKKRPRPRAPVTEHSTPS